MEGAIIGIDFGKHIGLAFCSEKLSIALPYCTVKSIAHAAEKIKEKNGRFLVVGWPLLLSGKEGEQCRATKLMLDQLLKHCPLPYHLQDERFSSKFSSSKHKMTTDHEHSAAWILQTFLNSAKNKF